MEWRGNPASQKRRRGADCNVWVGVGWVGVHVFAPDGTDSQPRRGAG
jgi:hypothetical protein